MLFLFTRAVLDAMVRCSDWFSDSSARSGAGAVFNHSCSEISEIHTNTFAYRITLLIKTRMGFKKITQILYDFL